MLEVRNDTPFQVAILPGLDASGADYAAVVVKATYALADGGRRVEPAEEQAPVQHADACSGDPGVSSVRYASDAGPHKVGTDVVLNGHCYPPGGRPAPVADVGFLVGPVRKVARVFGERLWYQALGSWKISPPVPFEKMPLAWERAFGGADTTHPDPRKHAVEARNPVGRGFIAARTAERMEKLPLPNLEKHTELITSWDDRPEPVGFGFTAPDWLPRRTFGGTYDDAWRRTRAPFLPLDFDVRFHSAAAPGLVVTPHLLPGAPVRVVGASPEGELGFAVPDARLEVVVHLKGRRLEPELKLDTLVVEPDVPRALLTWRAVVPCPRQLLYLDRVEVSAGGGRS